MAITADDAYFLQHYKLMPVSPTVVRWLHNVRRCELGDIAATEDCAHGNRDGRLAATLCALDEHCPADLTPRLLHHVS